MRKNRLTFNIFLLIVMTDVVESLAELFMKQGLTKAGISAVNLNNLFESVSRGAASWLIWLGVLLYIVNFFIWIAVLSRVQLSVAFPMGSTCYVYVPILATVFLHEHVGLVRWAGIALIILGIHVVSKSSQRE